MQIENWHFSFKKKSKELGLCQEIGHSPYSEMKNFVIKVNKEAFCLLAFFFSDCLSFRESQCDSSLPQVISCISESLRAM